MKIRSTALVASIFVWGTAVPVVAQGWQWQNPLPQGNRLGEVQFVDLLHGWIRTEGGTILRTTDGGHSWTEEVIKHGAHKIYFVDPLNGWAVGSGVPPFIVRTRDGGKSWENLPIPAERNTGNFYNFLDVFFLDLLNGYVSDDAGGIFHTIDGGQTWTRQFQHRQHRDIRSIWFVDSLKGWAIGEGTPLLYTTDGGKTWLPDSTVIGGIDALNRRIFFTDSLHGWILTGEEKIYRTTNGGKQWRPSAIDTAVYLRSTEMTFLNSAQGWLSGYVEGPSAGGKILYRTVDGGGTWIRIHTGVRFTGLLFLNEDHGWATAEVNKLLETTDGGWSWVNKTESVTAEISNLVAVDFLDGETGWVVGYEGPVRQRRGLILHTKDGGKTWKRQLEDYPSAFRDVQFIDRSTGWVTAGTTILRTDNGGITWEAYSTGYNVPVSKIHFLNKDIGWAVGGDFTDTGVTGIVLYTTDGGKSWVDRAPRGVGRLFGVFFIDPLRGWVAQGGGSGYDRGAVYRTTDGGLSWQIQVGEPDDSFGEILFADSLYGWIASSDGGVLKTTDGGETWERKPIELSGGPAAITFVSHLHGWAVGLLGQIAYTMDGGETWSQQVSRTSVPLYGIDFVDERTGWAVGLFGTILHTTTGGATTVESRTGGQQRPKNFVLHRNYPNPFNTSTILSFDLLKPEARLTLSVYDLLGRLVKTLFDGERPRGSYQVRWDGMDSRGRTVSSGIYFYRLEVEGQVQVGKMALVR